MLKFSSWRNNFCGGIQMDGKGTLVARRQHGYFTAPLRVALHIYGDLPRATQVARLNDGVRTAL